MPRPQFFSARSPAALRRDNGKPGEMFQSTALDNNQVETNQS
jgi:hypothetical protein